MRLKVKECYLRAIFTSIGYLIYLFQHKYFATNWGSFLFTCNEYQGAIAPTWSWIVFSPFLMMHSDPRCTNHVWKFIWTHISSFKNHKLVLSKIWHQPFITAWSTCCFRFQLPMINIDDFTCPQIINCLTFDLDLWSWLEM